MLNFSLIPITTASGPMHGMSFTPSSGMLNPDQKQKIVIDFKSTLLGNFVEDILWEIEGASEPIYFSIKGKVVGPTYTLSRSLIDFGRIPFGLDKQEYVDLLNTSDIDMHFALSVAQSQQNVMILLDPESGILPPKENARIMVTLQPGQARDVSALINMDISGAQTNLPIVKIQARTVIAQVQFTLKFLLLNISRFIQVRQHSLLRIAFWVTSMNCLSNLSTRQNFSQSSQYNTKKPCPMHRLRMMCPNKVDFCIRKQSRRLTYACVQTNSVLWRYKRQFISSAPRTTH